MLAEWNPVLKAPTQEALAVRVTYMTDFAMPEGYVVMAIKPLVP